MGSSDTWPLCLDPFIVYVFKDHPHGSMYQCFIPFYGWMKFTVCIWHSLCTQPRTWGALPPSSHCDYPAVNITAAALKFEPLCAVLLGEYQALELLGHIGSSIVNSFGTANLFPQQQYHFAFPLTIFKGSRFSTFLPTLFSIFIATIVGVKWLLWFWFIFPWWLMLLTVCVLQATGVSSLEKCLGRYFAFELGCLSFCYWIVRLFVRFPVIRHTLSI